jgi:hypothetical protein
LAGGFKAGLGVCLKRNTQSLSAFLAILLPKFSFAFLESRHFILDCPQEKIAIICGRL